MPIGIDAVQTAIEYEYRFTEYEYRFTEYGEIRCDARSHDAFNQCAVRELHRPLVG
jgi:hypothetical protein